jgi:uncharacterized protein (UPF0335 family)
MTLSSEQRQQLRAEAERLRTEVSSLVDERDAAFRDQAQDLEDAKLVTEILRLQKQRDEAERLRDAAVGSTGDALAVMQAAIDAQAPPVAPDEKVIEEEALPLPTEKKSGGSR